MREPRQTVYQEIVHAKEVRNTRQKAMKHATKSQTPNPMLPMPPMLSNHIRTGCAPHNLYAREICSRIHKCFLTPSWQPTWPSGPGKTSQHPSGLCRPHRQPACKSHWPSCADRRTYISISFDRLMFSNRC